MNDDPRQPLVRKRAQVWVALSCALGAGYVLVDVLAQRWTQAQSITLARDSGWLALCALSCALCATPLGRALGCFAPFTCALYVPHVRRGFGIASALLALLHAALGFFGFLQASWPLVTSWPQLRAGALALCILLALLLTSFPRLVRALRLRTWKELHRLAYVAAGLVLQHVLLSPFASCTLVLTLYAAVGGIGLLRLLPRASREAQASSGSPDSAQKRASTAA